MKKFSLSAACISLVLIAGLTTTSCSRKVGCYFSDAQKVERSRNNESLTTVTYSKLTNEEENTGAVDISCR